MPASPAAARRASTERGRLAAAGSLLDGSSQLEDEEEAAARHSGAGRPAGIATRATRATPRTQRNSGTPHSARLLSTLATGRAASGRRPSACISTTLQHTAHTHGRSLSRSV